MHTMLHPQDHSRFQTTLLNWYHANKRDLPWRTHTTPYRVWVSEIMLQQTQMERGVAYFHRWMDALPDIKAVADANEDTVLKLWEGLGYYSRVRNLHKAARIIMQEHRGHFPNTLQAIKALPGIGNYTAGAIGSIAFNLPVPAVDANVERVFSRLYDIDTPIKDKENMSFVYAKAEELLPAEHAQHWNQAIMELGALICSKKAHCHQCPLSHWCEAYHLGIPHERPVKKRKKPITHLNVGTGFLVHEGKIYVQKRPMHGVWAGFWELPGGVMEEGETPNQTIVREFMEEMEFPITPLDKITTIKHGYTTYQVSLHAYFVRLQKGCTPEPVLHAATEYKWASFEELDELTMPAGHRKLVDFLKQDMRLQAVLTQTSG